jgi:hypothetical protein
MQSAMEGHGGRLCGASPFLVECRKTRRSGQGNPLGLIKAAACTTAPTATAAYRTGESLSAVAPQAGRAKRWGYA